MTLTDHHDALGSFCVPVFCDFVRNYSCTVDGAVVTLQTKILRLLHWRSLRRVDSSKILGGQTKILGASDKCMGVSQLLRARALATPKVGAYGLLALKCHLWSSWPKTDD